MGKRVSFDGLLERLYASGTDPGGVSSFLRELQAPFNAHITALHLHDIDHRLHYFNKADGVSDREVALYAARIEDGRHLWFERSAAKLASEGIADDRELSTQHELLPSSFYQDFLRPMDIRHGMALGLHVGTEGQLAALTINRDAHRGHFRPEELRLGKRLLPHVRNIYALQQRLSWMETLLSGFRAALDRLPSGAFLLDRHGRILVANQGADQLCADRCGMVQRERRLDAHWPADREPLHRLIERASAGLLAPTPETLLLHDDRGIPVASISASPTPPAATAAWSEPAVVAILFVRRLRPHAPAVVDALRHAFGFSRAEAELAAQLREGATLAEASARSGKRIATVRTQLRALFSKTGTHRQAELIRVLIASLAGLGGA